MGLAWFGSRETVPTKTPKRQDNKTLRQPIASLVPFKPFFYPCLDGCGDRCANGGTMDLNLVSKVIGKVDRQPAFLGLWLRLCSSFGPFSCGSLHVSSIFLEDTRHKETCLLDDPGPNGHPFGFWSFDSYDSREQPLCSSLQEH